MSVTLPDPMLANLKLPSSNTRPRKKRRDGRWAASLIFPNLAMFTIFIIVPVLGGLLLSFTTWDITNGFPKWVGLANYREMIHDPLVWKAVNTTLKFIAMGVLPTIVISLGLALLINFKFRGFSVVRSLYLIPAAMSFAASAVVWRFIFLDGPGYGIIDYVISKFGVTPPDWLASTTWTLPALDIIGIWLSLPIATILFLAAMQRIPDSVIEAAKIDGAGPLRRVRYIIWPGVRYMTPLVTIIALLAFTNGSFDLVNILTKGNPLYTTQTLIFYIFQQSFALGYWGYAAALSVLQIAIIGGILGLLRVIAGLASRW